MTDIVSRIWGFCHTLRHDGIDYGDYIEQITYLLFLKMADEKHLDLPEGTDWAYLRKQSGTQLLDEYQDALRILGKEPGMLGDIFSGAQSRFTNPVNLKRLLSLIDETEWRSRLGKRYAAPAPVYASYQLPESWCWTSIGSLVDVATGATPLRNRTEYYGGDVPWVTSSAVNAGLITEPTDWITELALKETNAKIFERGTLLVAMYGEGQTRGRVAELGIRAATNQAVAALMFDDFTPTLRPYLKIFLLENYERIRALSFGGVQPNLSLEAIRRTPVPLPPLAEQAEIVQRVDRVLALTDSLKARIDAAVLGVSQSSQSVLAKAFRGQLRTLDT